MSLFCVKLNPQCKLQALSTSSHLLWDSDPGQPDPGIYLVPNVSLWLVPYRPHKTEEEPVRKNTSRMKLVIFYSHRESGELWGPQSTSGTELLNFWETLVESVELSFVWSALCSSEMSVVTRSMSWNFWCACTPYFGVWHSSDSDKWLWLQHLLLLKDQYLPVQEFVRSDSKAGCLCGNIDICFTRINDYAVSKTEAH